MSVNIYIKTSYAVSSSLIVMAPLLIAAACYICLGRLIICVLPRGEERLLGLNPIWITRIFVTSDAFSFLIQASGSGVASSQNWDGKTGLNMLIAGLALQLVTNIVFMTLTAAYLRRTFYEGRVRQNAPKRWESVSITIVISIVLIFV